MGRRIFSPQKPPAGRTSNSKYNPNTLTRMPPTQYPLSGKAAPPPNSRDAFPSLQQGADPLGWTQGDPREPQGAQGYRRAPSAPLGGMGPRGPLGLYRSHSEWNPFRLNGYYETTPKLKPWLESRLKGKVSKYYQNLSKIRVALGPK